MKVMQRLRTLKHASLRTLTGAPGARAETYEDRLKSEQHFFGGDRSAYDLPEIYNYWSNTYLRPILESFGYSTPDEMFCGYFEQSYRASEKAVRAFVSIGAGDCATEITIADELVKRGCTDFILECVELNADLLATARAAAVERGLAAHVVTVQCDFNQWEPNRTYDGVLANNSLHHVVNLEGLLEGIRRSLAATGTFVTSDMIGRNGHMRWPEALELVHEYWRELPAEYRYNHLLKRHEELYENWDCSTEAFEGIRAQDILRLLIAHFDFDVFVPFANIVDPFIERCFGHNFSVDREWDTRFIDRIHARDQAEILRGAIKPTHIVAAMCAGRPGRNLGVAGLTPRFCVRLPEEAPVAYRSASHAAPEKEKQSPSGLLANPVPLATPAAETTEPRSNYTDLWWNPVEPGWGLSIHHHDNDQLMASWLAHDAGGSPTWFSLQPGEWVDPSTFRAIVYATRAATSPSTVFRAPGSLRPAGEATLRFTDRDHGTLSYSIDGESGETPIARMKY